MFMGSYSHSLDPKGRLIIPAKIREELGEEFIMTRGQDNCLTAYPMAEWKRLLDAIERLPKFTNEAATRMRRATFGNGTVIEVDKQGRILIPAGLRKTAGLTKDVTLVGVDNHLEIWDSEKWDAYNESVDLNEILRDLEGFQL